MHKPAYQPHILLKSRVNWEKSFYQLHQLFIDPSSIRPADLADDVREAFGYRTLKRTLPKIKGNVCRTMEKILQIFIKDWRKSSRPINLSIRTNRASLAKACRNRDPKTAGLHILALIEAGFLRAKVRLGHGLQLLLNPALVVFDEAAPRGLAGSPAPAGAATRPAPRPTSAAPAAAVDNPAPPRPLDMRAHLAQMAENLKDKFSTGKPRRT